MQTEPESNFQFAGLGPRKIYGNLLPELECERKQQHFQIKHATTFSCENFRVWYNFLNTLRTLPSQQFLHKYETLHIEDFGAVLCDFVRNIYFRNLINSVSVLAIHGLVYVTTPLQNCFCAMQYFSLVIIMLASTTHQWKVYLVMNVESRIIFVAFYQKQLYI